VIDFRRLSELTRNLRSEWESATPYPYVVIDNFLPADQIERAVQGFDDTTEGWIFHNHYNERKYAHSKKQFMSPAILELFSDLESPQWLKFLEDVTGIKRLLADETMDGSSGLHKSLPGCFLRVHRETVGHNRHEDWRRQVNLLLYLNKDWKAEWDGELQIIDHKTMTCVKEITPYLNRLVLFHTNPIAFHGNPKVLKSPEGTVRKSLTSYYFTQEEKKVGLHPVLYRPEAGDGAGRRARIALTNMALRVYFPLRKYTPLNDEMVDKVMRKVGLSRD
jgi:Rps23 Pro-64 3,4-dihydroxylase Tpa1-like proline 4-hydroxylase